MRRIFPTLLFWTLVLCACSTERSSPTAAPSATLAARVPLTAILASPTLQPTTQDCSYQWSNQDLPELSTTFQRSVQALQPGAQASARAFGENCIRADGKVAHFLATETDFNIAVRVDDLANESVLGKWIVKIMQVIENIPADQVAGPRPGRVSIVFQSSTAQAVINFYINQYQELPSRFNYAEIYEALKALQ